MRLPAPDPLSIGLIYLSAIFMAVKEGTSRTPTLVLKFPALAFEGMWNYLPIALLSIAALMWIAELGRRAGWDAEAKRLKPLMDTVGLEADPVTQTVRTKEPEIARVVRPKDVPKEPPPPEDKVFVPPGTTAERIMSVFHGKTEAQGTRLCEPFIGKWMTLRGKVGDVGEGYADSTSVRFDSYNQNTWSRYVTFNMAGPDGERAQAMHAGDAVTITGRIRNAAGHAVRFSDAFFAADDAPAIPFPTPEPKTPRRKAKAAGS